MKPGAPPISQNTVALPRVLGEIHGDRPGPSLIVLGGIHGNEPAGVAAAQDVLRCLARRQAALRGDVVALAGNTRALARGVRFVDRDLNRGWSAAGLGAAAGDAAADAAGPGPTNEDIEQQELWAALEAARGAARGPIHFLDLHTTSADGIPFAMVGDSPPVRAFARHFPLPLIRGLLEQVDGALLEWMRGLGCVTLGVEAGQHTSPEAARHHTAVLWVALVAAGLLPAAAVPELDAARDLLARARRDLPHQMQVHSRHAIRPDDRFRMRPGFANIQRVRAGDHLADDRRGPIRAERDGILFMPLYQPQGDDGFFFGGEVAAG